MDVENFFSLLKDRHKSGNYVCVGLDTDYGKIPESAKKCSVKETILFFNQKIIDATAGFVCAYKPNRAFYAPYGTDGYEALKEIIQYIHDKYPGIPIILDAKEGDIGKSNIGYVDEAFNYYDADAVTVHPYLGSESVKPFLDKKDKGIIVLCRTSNPGAGEFQDLVLQEGIPLYQKVAKTVFQKWNYNKNCAVVAGATYPKEIAEIRKIIGDDIPILIPGVGTQGGDLKAAVEAGGEYIIVNSSSAIIFASKGSDFAEAAGKAAAELNTQIKNILREQKVLRILAKVGAVITNSHIVYTSGKHGSAYVNKDAVYPHTEETSDLCREIAQEFAGDGVEVVIAPAIGGVILSQWIAHWLKEITGVDVVFGVYAERDEKSVYKAENDTMFSIVEKEIFVQSGDEIVIKKPQFVIKRGYDKIVAQKKVLVVEDVLTTGGSAKKVVETTRAVGGNVVGLGVLCNRGGITPADVANPPKFFALVNVKLDAYEESNCPLCEKKLPINTNVGKGKNFLARK